MKKTYINPAIEVVKVQIHQMLATSVIETKGNYGDGSGITLGGRNMDFDDDEE